MRIFEPRLSSLALLVRGWWALAANRGDREMAYRYIRGGGEEELSVPSIFCAAPGPLIVAIVE